MWEIIEHNDLRYAKFIIYNSILCQIRYLNSNLILSNNRSNLMFLNNLQNIKINMNIVCQKCLPNDIPDLISSAINQK